MFKKIVKNLEPSSTLKINEISKELEDRGKEIFKFGFGQSPFEIPTNIVSALKDNHSQQQIAKNYQEAEAVVKNCEIKLIELRGAISALEEIQKASIEEDKTTSVMGSVVPTPNT